MEGVFKAGEGGLTFLRAEKQRGLELAGSRIGRRGFITAEAVRWFTDFARPPTHTVEQTYGLLYNMVLKRFIPPPPRWFRGINAARF